VTFPFQIGRLYALADFRADWAANFWRFGPRFCLPTEAVVRGRGPHVVVPNEARTFTTSFQLYLGRFPMTQDQLRVRGARQGRDLLVPWPEWVYMVEVWTNCGSDGHTEYELVGYRFVPESDLNKLDPRTEMPWCMGMMEHDYEEGR